MIELRAIPGKTGRLLRAMLQERGLMGPCREHPPSFHCRGPVEGAVNWGYTGTHEEHLPLPTLNARAGTFNKYEELVRLREKGISVPNFHLEREDRIRNYPLLGRSFHHTRGRDIFFVSRWDGWRGYYPGRSDYFTELIPKLREFRVWAYRRKCIGVYEKVLRYPRKNGRRGRSREIWNWKNGYAFVYHREGFDEARELGVRAVDALGLDFGAADIILGIDGRFYVLEVNSAPGVQSPRQALTSLVNHIERWARNGFKRRNGDGESREDGAVPRRALL